MTALIDPTCRHGAFRPRSAHPRAVGPSPGTRTRATSTTTSWSCTTTGEDRSRSRLSRSLTTIMLAMIASKIRTLRSPIAISMGTIDHADGLFIRSGSFPSTDGTDRTFAFNHDPDHMMDDGPDDFDANTPETDGNLRNDYDRYRVSGTFMGASGHFECTGQCRVHDRAARGSLCCFRHVGIQGHGQGHRTDRRPELRLFRVVAARPARKRDVLVPCRSSTSPNHCDNRRRPTPQLHSNDRRRRRLQCAYRFGDIRGPGDRPIRDLSAPQRPIRDRRVHRRR